MMPSPCMEEKTSISEALIEGVAGTGVLRLPHVNALNGYVVSVERFAQTLEQVAADIFG